MNKSTSKSNVSSFVLEFDANKKMSEYWLDFQQYAKEHKSVIAEAKAKRDAAIRAANDEFAKVKETEDAAIKAAYAEFQRIQREFQSGRAERRAERVAAAEAKAAEKAAEKPAETKAETPTEKPAELADVDTTGLTAEEIELLKAAAA